MLLAAGDSKEIALSKMTNFIVRNNLSFNVTEDPDMKYIFKKAFGFQVISL